MAKLEYSKPEIINLQNHPELDEKWVQERIAEDPSLFGLGELIVKDKERIHPQAGRLDLLCQDAVTNHRYEIEIQLGKIDESHIIRCIEYWDIERKRYPQYNHTAVLIAENITSRFLNVIGLFNGSIPLVAIQMKAIRLGNNISLIFTTVLNEMARGLVDEDEESREVTDRAYWENRGTKNTLEITDALFAFLREFAPDLTLKYNKYYIGLANKSGAANNFVTFTPTKSRVLFEPRLERSLDITDKLEIAGIDCMEYDNDYKRYRIRLAKGDLEKHGQLLCELMKKAWDKARD